jgi:hypothetical protein
MMGMEFIDTYERAVGPVSGTATPSSPYLLISYSPSLLIPYSP